MQKIISQIRDIVVIEKELVNNPIGILALNLKDEKITQLAITFLYQDKNVYFFFKDNDEEFEHIKLDCKVSFTIVKNDKIKKTQKADFTLLYNILSVSISGLIKVVDDPKLVDTLRENYIKKYSDFDKEYFNNKDKNFKNYIKWVEESGNYLKAIIEKIKEFGLYENSIIIIFTDHGVSTGDKIGEKAYGVYLYDYTIKCFLYLIGKDFPKGIEVKSLIRSIDIMPTIMDMLKIKEKNNHKKIQGTSFLNFINGKSDERIAYCETGGLGGPTPSPERHNVKAVRANKWKLIYNETNKNKELYDLEQDPEENHNLIGKNKEIEDSLWREMVKPSN